jgi:hypothetical protein
MSERVVSVLTPSWTVISPLCCLDQPVAVAPSHKALALGSS